MDVDGNISPSNTLPQTQPSSNQVVDNQYWIRLSLGNNIHGTESVRDVLRNDMKIPNDGKLVHTWIADAKLMMSKKQCSSIPPYVWENWLGPCKSGCTQQCNRETNIDDLDVTSLDKIFNFAEKIIPTDILSEADIINIKENYKTSMESLKSTRNDLAHHSFKEEIPKQDFDDRWNKLKDTLVKMGYKQLKRFDELETCCLDPYLKEQVLVINVYLEILDDTKCDKSELKDHKAEIEKKLEDFIKEQKQINKDQYQINKEQELFNECIARKVDAIEAPVARDSTNGQTNQESEVTAKSNSLKLERSSNKECLFSVMDINISESSFKCKYKDSSENQWLEVNQENLKIQDAENMVYFLVKSEFLTGLCYNFIICMESSNGDTVCFGFDDHYVREIIEQSYQDKPSFIAHDDGTKENINVFEIKNLPAEDQKCQGIKGLYDKVADFRKASEQHLVDQGDFRFPPSFYLAEGATKQFGDEFEKFSQDSYIITGYNPIPHLKFLGFTDKHFKDNSISKNLWFENVVTVLAPKKSLILVSVIVETQNAKTIKSELHNLNDILKAVYAAAHRNISKLVVKVIGTLVLPEISKVTLGSTRFLFLDHSQHHNNEKGSGSSLFLTKEQMEFSALQIWWNNLSSGGSSNSFQEIENVAGEMITSMCIIDSYLPRVTSDTGKKIASLLLNKDQIAIILDSRQWKFITGPHGSGKSICLKEIAKRLHQKKDGVKVVYICYEPFSLLETEIRMFFETISNDGTLQSLSISTISSEAGYSVDQFCNQLGPPEKSLADLLEYLTKTYGKCHLLVDEFHTDNITPQYCEQLKQWLKKNFQNSTLVIATQSSSTTKHLINKGVTVLEYEKCRLQNAGMTEMLLEKAMRVPSEIFDLAQTAIDCIDEKDTVLSLPSVKSQNAVGSKTKKPPALNKNTPNKSDFTKVGAKSSRVLDDIVAPPAKKRKKDINKTKLADLQYFAKKNNEANANQHSELQLKTNTVFVSGRCGTVSSKKKPTLFSLYNDFSISDDKSCRVFAEILKKCILQTQHRISFICNDINEITCVAYALEICKQKFITYAPFLLGQLPSSEERLKVTEQLDTQIGSHLIIDYRSCKGCEFRHCVVFISPKVEYQNHALIEMITRTTSNLTIFVYPYTKSGESTTCLENVIADWNKEEAVHEVKIEFKPKKHKCTLYIGGKEHGLRIEESNLQKFSNVQQYIHKQDQYKNENTLQYVVSSIPTSEEKWDGTIYRSIQWNGKTYTFDDVWEMLVDEPFDTLKPMLDNIPFVIESLRGDGSDSTLLMVAVWLFPLFQFLLPYVRDFNCVDKHGSNVAHCIAAFNDDVGVEMFELIKKEMTLETFPYFINKLDDYDESSLHYVAYKNKHNTIKYLIANGANVNVRNKGGEYPDEQDGCDDETQRIIRQHRN